MIKQGDLLIIIDMNNGFVKNGALASPNVLKLVPHMRKFVKQCIVNNIDIWHYVDSHKDNCPEFNVYPKHCIENSKESQVIDELDFKEIKIIHKNSTNGFLVKNPLLDFDNIFVIGCVTDICVFDFAYTALKYIHQQNSSKTVTVIENLCATFDAPNHDSNEIHRQFINKLKYEGAKIISI